VNHGVFGYAFPPEDYAQVVTAWMDQRHRWTIQPDWVVPTGGVVFDIMTAIRGLTAVGDTVVIQPPVYFPFFFAVTRSKRELATNPLIHSEGRYQMDLEGLEKLFQDGARALVLCSPHNPGGMVWTAEELGALADLCLKYGVLVISDEIHCDLVLPGARHTPFASLSEKVQAITVTLGAPSKTFNIPALAVSHATIADEELRDGFKEEMARVGIMGPKSVLGMVAQHVAYSQGARWLDELTEYLGENRAYLMDFVSRQLPAVRAMRPEATYLVWLDFRELGLSDDDLAAFLLEQAGLALSAGIRFGEEGSGFMRLNFGCPRSVLRQALTQLEQAVNQIQS
jgi:cystathionine beta-lyase